MKRILASSLGLSLGLLASAGRADDVVWRAAKNSPPAQPTVPAAPVPSIPPPGSVQPVAVLPTAPVPPTARTAAIPAAPVAAAPADGVNWIRARAQISDVNGLAAPTAAPSDFASPIRRTGEPLPPPVPVKPMAPATPAQILPNTGLNTVPVQPMPIMSEPASSGPVFSHPMPSTGAISSPATSAGEHPVFILGETSDLALAETPPYTPRLEVYAQYLLWWTKGDTLPPLLTTSPPGLQGTLPGSAVLIGNQDVHDGLRSGGRFGGVFWCDTCASQGFDGSFFFLGQSSESFAFNSGTNPVLGLYRPFFAGNNFPPAQFPGPFREVVTEPGVSAGTFRVETTSNLWGADINYRDNLCSSCWYRFDLLAGFRYLNLRENLSMVEDYTLLRPDVLGNPAGTHVVIFDRFGTTNDFYGGQIGTAMRLLKNRWSLDLRGTVALGTTVQNLVIEGGQSRVPPAGQGAPQQLVGGLLALNSNIGDRTRNAFSVVPEIGINLGFQLTDHWRVFGGYNFLYWSNVIRPGDQIDPVIDVNRVPAFVPPALQGQIPAVVPPRPAVLFKQSDFWAQGVNMGLEYRW